MATLHSPVELPAGRQSFVEFPMTASISDPTSWDAFSNDGELTRRNSKQTITSEYAGRAFPKPPSRVPSRSQQSVRSKASPAIEFPPQELEAQPMSYFPPRGSSAQNARHEQSRRQVAQETSSDAGHLTHSSDDYTASTSSASTAGTGSVQENQVYSLSPTSPAEEMVGSPVLHSSRSASNSVKKSTVPTSKYKKKPPPSLKSSIRRKSNTESPLDSPMSGYTQVIQSPTLTQTTPSLPSELPAAVTPTAYPSPPPEPQVRTGQAPLQHAKSTASVRKARALHSHPSLPTIKTEATTSPVISQPSPAPSTSRSRKSVDTVRNRPSLYELQEPSPAPTAPLPELPVGARPLSRSPSGNVGSAPMPPPDAHVRPGTSSSNVAPTLRRQDTNSQAHAEMANFMTSNSKVIFRRFHDVHVRLLLTLQDEISTLEKELAEIESADNPIDPGREARRVRVLSELRKLLAEYDHLFSNWNLMQSSKADAKTKEELERFLHRHAANGASNEALGAAEDLLWLQDHSSDLSCVDLSSKKDKVAVSQTEVLSEKRVPQPTISPVTTRSPSGGGGGGGFAALFASCAGRRK